MATIKDIARLTGVSTATVSNVLNGKPGAASADKTREIRSVAQSLHYEPNVLAKTLKGQRTGIIGIITEDLTVFHTPEIVDGIITRIARRSLMATIKDIARLTGVSTATVSNVLNDKPGAASAAKAREIRSVAKSLHYRPNALAKNLKQQRTNTIGIITEDLTVFNAPEIVDGISAYCEEQGYEILLANMRLFKRYSNDFTDTPEHQQLLDHTVSTLAAKQVEGIAYVGYHCREISYLPSRVNVPFVYVYCYPRDPIYPSVMLDDGKASREVMDLLIEKGHRNIGVLLGPPSSRNTVERRRRGVEESLASHGLPFNPDLFRQGDWEVESGYYQTDSLLRQGVTAVFALNDLMAVGVCRRCAEKGIVVGRDLDVFGFDNREISRISVPPISTVQPPLNEMGHKCAEMLLAMIQKKKVKLPPTQMDCAIIRRDSTK